MRNKKTDPAISGGNLSWQRIEAIINHYRFISIHAFARELGLNSAENLYQIKKGNNGISMELAKRLTEKYPQLNRTWILTGEGTMLPDQPDPAFIRNKVARIPYYDNFPFNKPPDKPDKILYYSRELICDGEFAVVYRDDAL